jgi:hypothetical protein
MRLPFIPNSYQGRSTAFESQRFINLCPELALGPNDKGVGMLIGAPGKRLFSSGLSAPVRGAINFNNTLYAVESNKLVSVSASGVASVVGSLNTSTGRVSMSENGLLSAGIGGNQICIVDGVNGYIYDVVTQTFTVVSNIPAVQATAAATVSTSPIQSVTVTAGGSGYSAGVPPTASVAGGGGSGAVLQVVLGFPIFSVNFSGSLATTGTPVITVTDPTGTGAIITPVVVSNSISSVVVTAAGNGYTNPTLTITNTPGLLLTPTLNTPNGSVISVNVTAGGSGYSAPVVTFSSGAATATATVSSKTITSITVTVGGSGYINPPAVTVTGTGGTTTAVATVVNSSVTAITITSGGTGYTGPDPTVTLSVPTGTVFPTTPQHVEFIDGYFIITNGTMNAYASELFNGLLWNALATTPVQAFSDNVQNVVNLHQQLFFIKQVTSEVFYNNATATALGFPFSRMQGAVIDYGTPAPWTVAKGAGSAFFLANERDGDNACFVGVVQLNGYTPVPITPQAIVYKMGQSTDLSQCFGFCYSDKEGHTFYQITNPVDDWTFLYDTTTQMWHERSTATLIDDFVHRDNANCYVNAYGMHLVGDVNTGNLYEVNSKFNTDLGVPIISDQITQHIIDNSSLEDVFIGELQIDIESGVGLSDVSSPATAFTTLTADSVTDITITYNGADYTVVPTVFLLSADGNGTGATATATVTYGSVTDILVTAGGSGYTSAPQVVFAVPEVVPTGGLSRSKDGGKTFGPESIRSMGKIGEFRKRLLWRSLGRTKNLVWRLRISSPVKKIVMGWYAEPNL